MEKCVIEILPYQEGRTNAIIQSGGLSDIEIYRSLSVLTKGYAQRIVDAAEKHIGSSDPKELESYLNTMINLEEQKDIWKIINGDA